jgi:hypothetical protein
METREQREAKSVTCSRFSDKEMKAEARRMVKEHAPKGAKYDGFGIAIYQTGLVRLYAYYKYINGLAFISQAI